MTAPEMGFSAMFFLLQTAGLAGILWVL